MAWERQSEWADLDHSYIVAPDPVTDEAIVVFEGTIADRVKEADWTLSSATLTGPSGAKIAASADLTLDPSNDVVVKTNGTTYVTFDGGNQRVGIGTATPSSKLHVAGNVQIDADKAFKWGAATQIVGNNSSTLELQANTNLLLNPDDNVLVQANGTGYAKFDGTQQSLSLGHTASPSGATLLDVRNTPTGNGTIVDVVNEAGTGVNKRIVRLEMANDATIGAAEDWIRFMDSGGEVGAISAEVTYGPFTGSHLGGIKALNVVVSTPEEVDRFPGDGPKDLRATVTTDAGVVVWRRGMIVRSTGDIPVPSMSNALPRIEVTTTAKDPCVMGVFAGIRLEHGSKYFPDTDTVAAYNALGEGQILVCDLDGAIACGDLIASSAITGMGSRQLDGAGQPDTLFHSYTVAKCTQTIDWSQVTETTTHAGRTVKVALVGCTYHCG